MIFGENDNYHPIQNAYLQGNRTIENFAANPADRNCDNVDAIKLIKNAFAYTFKEARLGTTGGSDLEHKEYIGQIQRLWECLQVRMGI